MVQSLLCSDKNTTIVLQISFALQILYLSVKTTMVLQISFSLQILYLCVKTDIGTTVNQECRSYKSQILIVGKSTRTIGHQFSGLPIKSQSFFPLCAIKLWDQTINNIMQIIKHINTKIFKNINGFEML